MPKLYTGVLAPDDAATWVEIANPLPINYNFNGEDEFATRLSTLLFGDPGGWYLESWEPHLECLYFSFQNEGGDTATLFKYLY